MAMLTLEYKRILPDISVALLKDKATGKGVFRHRFIEKAKNSSYHGKQNHKDYPVKSVKYNGMKEFEQFIKTKFEYD